MQCCLPAASRALGLELVDMPRRRRDGWRLPCCALPGGGLVESLFDIEKRRATLLPVLPAGQQELYGALIGLSIRQGFGQMAHGRPCIGTFPPKVSCA